MTGDTQYQQLSQAERTYGSVTPENTNGSKNPGKTYGSVSPTKGEMSDQEDKQGYVKNKQQAKNTAKQMKMKGASGVVGTACRLALNEMQPEHITNLALFGLDRSDGDLNWHWQSVGDLISEVNDPARPPIKGCNRKFIHWKLRRIVENIYFRLFTFLLIFLDIGLVITEIVISCSGHPISKAIRNIDVILSVYFVIEVFLRIIALTPKVFFSKSSWHNVIDFIVVILAFGATIAAIVILKNIPETEFEDIVDSFYGVYKCEKADSASKGKSFSFIIVLRFVRIFRFVRLLRIYLDHRNLLKSVRQRISENKRRFQADGYDLDLTYVTTNVIAMSFPSKGTKALYRNKIDYVAKFFEDKHSDERNIDYMVYNLCSEMEYDHRKFHGNVRRYEIDDHNVPTLEQMLELVVDVRNWLQGGEGRSRVVALHCKGGKGRTGTMVCAVLIDQGLFVDAMESLQYFGQRRTDLNVSKQFQGVETYSQIRYVHYFQKLVNERIVEIPSNPLIVREINITGLRGVGAGDGSDFTMRVSNKGQEISLIAFSTTGTGDKVVGYSKEEDRLQVRLTGRPLVVDKDTKFLFQCSTKGVPKGYDDCAFFFWLHTNFISEDDQGVLRETMYREQLDNPHKEKTWRVWRDNFSVEVIFEIPEQSNL